MLRSLGRPFLGGYLCEQKVEKTMSPPTVGLVSIAFLFLLLAARMRIGLCLSLVGVLGFSYLVGPQAALSLVAGRTYETMANYGFTVIPLFILMGQVTYYSGLGAGIYKAAFNLVGPIPGGLAIANIFGCTLFAAVCGSGPATAATIGAVSFPELQKYKYDLGLATGSVAAGGTLGILIPPSVAFIVYAIITEESVSKLFMAGIIPGVLLSSLFVATIYFRVRRNPALAPLVPNRVSLKQKLLLVVNLWDSIALFVCVMGGLFIGVFTPTEAGAVGACASILVAVVRKRLGLLSLAAALQDTLRLTGMLFVVIIGAMIFSNFMVITQLPSLMVALGNKLPAGLVMIWIVIVCLVAGCVLDGPSTILLLTPIFHPVVTNLGFDTVWFGVLMVVLAEAGLITPPVGMNVYTLAGIADVPVVVIFKGIAPFLVTMIFFVILLLIFPQIALFLPGHMR